MRFSSVLKRATGIVLIFAVCITVMSSIAIRLSHDFLKELGISQAEADTKINQGIFGGYFNTYALGQVKKIPATAHGAIIESAFTYTRRYTASAVFKDEYEKVRQQAKPEPLSLPLTPDSLRKDLVKKAQQALESAEAALKNANKDTKTAFEEMVAAAKENLDDLKRPDNAYIEMYASTYDGLLENAKVSQAQMLAQWEQQYPPQVNAFIKLRLQQFMSETKEVDFKATTAPYNGKLKFTNPEYERKSNHWKLAYRMGEPAVNAARVQATRWLADMGH